MIKTFTFTYSDTISGFNPTYPMRGTLVRNFYATPSSADCVIGTFKLSTLACTNATPATVTQGPGMAGTVEFTGITSVPDYYTITAFPQDQAGNQGATITRTIAFGNVAPTIGAITQSPAAVTPLGSVTVSGSVTDNLDLASSNGRLAYSTATAPFQSVGGTSFGPNFDATLVTSGTATVSLPNVYRGLQSTDWTAAGNIMANTATPTATITVTDVGTNFANSVGLTIATTTPATNVLQVSITFTMSATSTAPATTQATTTLTVRVGGLVSDAAFRASRSLGSTSTSWSVVSSSSSATTPSLR